MREGRGAARLRRSAEAPCTSRAVAASSGGRAGEPSCRWEARLLLSSMHEAVAKQLARACPLHEALKQARRLRASARSQATTSRAVRVGRQGCRASSPRATSSRARRPARLITSGSSAALSARPSTRTSSRAPEKTSKPSWLPMKKGPPRHDGRRRTLASMREALSKPSPG